MEPNICKSLQICAPQTKTFAQILAFSKPLQSQPHHLTASQGRSNPWWEEERSTASHDLACSEQQSLVHTERLLAMRWQLYPVSQYVAHLLKWRTGRTFLSEKSFARSSFLNFSNAFFYCLLIVYQEWVMLFNEREEPYLACRYGKHIIVTYIGNTRTSSPKLHISSLG